MTGQPTGTPGAVCGVAGCTRPTRHGAYLCEVDVTELDAALADMPSVALALDARYLRQMRFSTMQVAVITGTREKPLPWDDRAGMVRRDMSRELLRYVMHLQDARGCSWPRTYTTAAMAGLVRGHLGYFRSSRVGVDAHAAFTAVHARALTAVDRPLGRTYLGACHAITGDGPCPDDLYADTGAAYVTCRRCQTNYSVAERRARLLVELQDQLACASDIGRGLAGLGLGITGDRIRKWKERGRLVAHPGARQEPLYRVGDVIDLAVATTERGPRRKAKPA